MTHFVDANGDGRPDQLPDLAAVARMRAIQTFLGGLAVDVVVALAILWFSVQDEITSPEAFVALGFMVAKTVAGAVAQYVFRRFIDQSGYNRDGSPKVALPAKETDAVG